MQMLYNIRPLLRDLRCNRLEPRRAMKSQPQQHHARVAHTLTHAALASDDMSLCTWINTLAADLVILHNHT